MNGDEGLFFELTCTNLSSSNTLASIHLGYCEENGFIAVYLLGPCLPENVPLQTYKELVIAGSITHNHLAGSLMGQSLQTLCDAISEGNAYISLFMTQYPDGEIRAQLNETGCSICQPQDCPILTLSKWGLIILVLGLCVVGVVALRRKVVSIN